MPEFRQKTRKPTEWLNCWIYLNAEKLNYLEIQLFSQKIAKNGWKTEFGGYLLQTYFNFSVYARVFRNIYTFQHFGLFLAEKMKSWITKNREKWLKIWFSLKFSFSAKNHENGWKTEFLKSEKVKKMAEKQNFNEIQLFRQKSRKWLKSWIAKIWKI